jgi:hypothetical protein
MGEKEIRPNTKTPAKIKPDTAKNLFISFPPMEGCLIPGGPYDY